MNAARTDIDALRADFPLLRDAKQIYLDSAATTQKPQSVLDAIAGYYRADNANVHRAAHALAARATDAFEAARESVRGFLNAASTREIIWTRGTTEAINLIAHSYAPSVLQQDDEILISVMEHHSNIVPWQLAAQRSGARLRACRVTPEGELDMDELRELINERTRIVALGHVSNALGSINPIADIAALAHDAGAILVVDGAQAVAHLEVDVQALGADFYAFSGHKLYGPTGIGALYGREALLESMPPWQSGGEMIEHVTLEQTTFNALPYKFEAGTPNIAGAVGLGAAIDYVRAIDPAALAAHEAQTLREATAAISQLPGVRVVGSAKRKTGVLSFVVDGAHPEDIGTLLDQQDVSVRTGHHCAMPLMQHLGLPGTTRASFGLYNGSADVTRFVQALDKALTFI
ncbi:MAG: cysteine desulfurase [Pseudomonadota bacterium]